MRCYWQKFTDYEDYDAVQLAASLTANDERILIGANPVTLISADNALNAAASLEGLAVDNPNQHP